MKKFIEKQRLMELMVNNPIEQGAKELMKQYYGISETDIEDYKKSKSSQALSQLEAKRDSKKVSKKEKELNEKRIEGKIDKFNKKLKRELERYKDDPDATKIIIDIVYSKLNVTYDKMGKGMKLDEKAMMMVAEGKQGSRARIINKNLRRSPEALYEQLKVDLNSEDLKRSEVDKVSRELFDILDQGSMVVVRNEKGAPVAKRDIMKYDTVISEVKERDELWKNKLTNSKVQGDMPLILTNNKYGLNDSPDFESISIRKESLDKQNDDDYRYWRTEVLRDNYITAAKKTFGENSPEYAEINELVNKFSTIDFERFSRTYRSGEIIYVYEMGLVDVDGIITAIKEGLSQTGGFEYE